MSDHELIDAQRYVTTARTALEQKRLAQAVYDLSEAIQHLLNDQADRVTPLGPSDE